MCGAERENPTPGKRKIPGMPIHGQGKKEGSKMIPIIKEIIDLTHPIYSNCPGFPTLDTVKVDVVNIQPRDRYNMEKLRDFTVHAGTHVDAPYHFCADGKKIDEIPVEDFQGPAIVLDLSYKKPNERITDTDLDKYADKIEPDDIVLLYTGWSLKRDFTEEYMIQWPDLDGKGAEYLVSKKIKGVGIDGLSIGGYGEEKAFPAHLALLGAGIWVCEEMYIPREILDYERWYYFGFPIKFTGCSGAQVRAVAVQFE